VTSAGGGFRLATADADGSVSLYTISPNNVVQMHRRLAGHLKAVNSLAFSPDATRLAAASEDGTVSVWDLTQHREIRRLTGHTGPVTVVAFSVDGSRILSAGRDGTARLWDVQTETEVRQIKLNQDRSWPGALAWAPDGDRFVIGARSGRESTSVLSLESRSELVVLAGVKNPVLNAAFTRDGNRIVGLVQASDSPFVIWDAHTGKELPTIGSGFSAAALTPDGSRALLANRKNGNALEVWETSTGSLSATLPGSGSASIPVLAISADGRKGFSIDNYGAVNVWDLPAPPAPDHQLQLFQADSPVECVTFSPDGYRGLSGDAANARVWNIESPAVKIEYLITNPVTAIACSPWNDRIVYATGQSNSTSNVVGLRVFNAGESHLARQRDQRRFETAARRYTTAVFFDGGKQIATANADGFIRTWDVQTEKNLESADIKIPVNSLAVIAGGAQVLIGANDNDLIVWDWKEKHEVGRLKGHTFHVYCVATSVDGKVAVSGGGDRTVRVWNVETREPVAVLAGHTARINSVSVSPYGKFILSGSDDGTVRLWKADAPNALLILEGHVGPVRSVALSPDANRALSGGADGTVRFWDLASAIDSGTRGD
jgi:WD40 repeat protein